MKRKAFKMKLTSGNVQEYMKRHDDIPENWPELLKAHSDAGISDYSIYYDEETKTLFAFQKLSDDETTADLPDNPAQPGYCGGERDHSGLHQTFLEFRVNPGLLNQQGFSVANTIRQSFPKVCQVRRRLGQSS